MEDYDYDYEDEYSEKEGQKIYHTTIIHNDSVINLLIEKVETIKSLLDKQDKQLINKPKYLKPDPKNKQSITSEQYGKILKPYQHQREIEPNIVSNEKISKSCNNKINDKIRKIVHNEHFFF